MEKHREAQFLAKQQLLSDQLKVAKAHLDTLKAKCNRVEEYSGRICNVVSDRFTALKQSLDKKKEEMISRILDDSFRVKEELNGAMKSAELIIGKSLQAVMSAEDSAHGDLHSSSSHLLGECLMELLLLPREDLGYCDKFLKSKVNLDVSHLQSLIEQLKPDSFLTEELGEGASAQPLSEVINGCDKQYSESRRKYSTFPSVETSETDELSTVSHRCSSEDSVTNTAVADDHLNTSVLGDNRADVQIPFLHYSEGMHLTAYICSVSGPSTFVAQPYGSQLVNLMHELSEFYDNDDGHGFDTLSPPKVGDICCAQFSEDNCWYRAEVTATKGSMCDEALSLTVEYVDYGNQECLPVHRIRLLDRRFSLFPRQALLCTLAGIELTPLCCSSNDGFSNTEWSPQILMWIKTLIAEKPVDLIVYRWLEGNRVEVDVCVPLTVVLSSESLSTLPSCITANSIVTYTRHKTCSSFSLLSMMQSFGLAIPLGSANQSLTENSMIQQFNDCEPITVIDEQVCLSISPPDPVLDEYNDVKSQSGSLSPVNRIQRPETLQPLSVELEKSGELTVYVCHIISPGNFYVYPLQEPCPRQMDDICNVLHNYFSEDCVQSALLSEQPVGELCCVQSYQDGVWCRGFITDIAEEQGVKKCLVHHIDYGDLQWYGANQLKPFQDELHQYPAQTVHCSLFDVHPCGNKQTDMESEDANNLWRSKTVEKFKQLADRRRLVAYIKAEDISTSCVLNSNLKTTFLVELIDTNGEEDININEEIRKCEGQGDLEDKPTVLDDSKCKDLNNSTDYIEHGSPIQQWNPMEADFLTSKNSYSYDDEDASVAIQGYKSSKRICRFYETSKGCVRGADCHFLHLDEGVCDSQLEEAFTGKSTTLCLPSVGDWVVVIATALISVTELFVQLPLGCTHPLRLAKDNEKSSAVQEPELSELVVEMTSYYSQNVFGDRDTLQPHRGEMVAAYFAPEESWYRALVLDTAKKKIKVCCVDYGNVEWISERDIRCIKEEYMTLPFQAVHCRLAGVEKCKSYPKESKRALEELVVGKVLIAHVVAKNYGNLLYVHLYACNDGEGIHINRVLTQKGFVSRQKTVSRCNVDISFQPG